jgi:DNA-binding CsgD family transcriptional regulator
MNFRQNPETDLALSQYRPSLAEMNSLSDSPVKLLRRMQLTDREVETLRYMAAGYTSEKIARDLYISKETVVSHRKNIIRKLGVANVTAAVAFALRNRLIS